MARSSDRVIDVFIETVTPGTSSASWPFTNPLRGLRSLAGPLSDMTRFGVPYRIFLLRSRR
jgi:hypothetical protein